MSNSDIIPQSIIVGPGLYLLSWIGNQIILTKTTYNRSQLIQSGIYDFVKIDRAGYFEGTSMTDIKFIFSDKIFNLSQEEIDELVKEMSKDKESDDQMTLFGNPFKQDPIGIPFQSNKCDHEFVPYFGLKETFDYCKKCDVKK
jgi:hypothetical protein